MTMRKLLQMTMRRMVENHQAAGLSIRVERGGEELCFLTEGMADIAAGTPIARDTIYRLYSMTKPICGAAAMILMERGELDLFTPVEELIPAFVGQQVWENGRLRPAKRPVMVHDLLQMTSGLSYPAPEVETGRQTAEIFDRLHRRLHDDAPMTTREFADAVGTCGLAFDPGTSWRYSVSADILGAVIEVVSGMRLGQFLEKEIFVPLGMDDTAFWVPPEKQHRLARTYEPAADGESMVEYPHDYIGILQRMDVPPAFESGGAGLASTLEDYARFALMLRRGGELDGVRILQPATVAHFTGGELMPQPQVHFDHDRGRLYGHTYGNLMAVCKNPGQAAMLARRGEYGWDGALGMYFSNLPDEDVTILIGMQKFDGEKWELVRRFRNIILSHL